MTPFSARSRSALDAVGDTPLVELDRIVPEGAADVFLKLEFLNPTGSHKDRMALAMIEAAEARGELRPEMTVLEYTGGSTGSSLGLVCAVKGYPLRIVSSDAFAAEKLETMRTFGAELTLVPAGEDGITPDLIPRMMEEASGLAEGREDVYFTDQFSNRDALEGYRRVGEELLEELDRVDAFCSAVGTAGLLVGTARALDDAGRGARVVALEPASSPVISEGTTGPHCVEGIGVGFVPPLLDGDLCDEARGVEEDEARVMARRLAREEGVFAGTSTGINVAGALRLAEELGPGHTVVTVACDTGFKYLAGDLYGAEGTG